MEALCTALPEECATFFVEDDPTATGGGTTFSLTPWSSEAAPIVVNCIETEITLIAGRDSRFEFPVRSLSDRRVVLEEVQRICEAVLSGAFAETIWSRGGDVVRVDGEVSVGDQTMKTSSRYRMSPFSKKEKIVVEYGPYCRVEDAASTSM